jgi:hypothetical protein
MPPGRNLARQVEQPHKLTRRRVVSMSRLYIILQSLLSTSLLLFHPLSFPFSVSCVHPQSAFVLILPLPFPSSRSTIRAVIAHLCVTYPQLTRRHGSPFLTPPSRRCYPPSELGTVSRLPSMTIGDLGLVLRGTSTQRPFKSVGSRGSRWRGSDGRALKNA